MATQGGNGSGKLLPHHVLDAFKYEVAAELGMTDEIAGKGWANMTSRDCGKVGGHIGGKMVRVMIRRAQQAMQAGNP
jgi:small acid-soluble spore protein F (minor alpha/beta-type SASP)